MGLDIGSSAEENRARQAGKYADECSRLRKLASQNARVRYTRHALEEMDADGIFKIDIVNMLCRCAVVLVEPSNGEESWRAEGSDSDGRVITAVVVAYEDAHLIKVITAWAGRRR